MEKLTKGTAKTLLLRLHVWMLSRIKDKKTAFEVSDMFKQLTDLVKTFDD